MQLRDLDVAALPPTLTPREVAALFGEHVESVREQCRRGTFPVEPLRLGRRLRFSTAKVLAVLGLDRAEAPTNRGPASISTTTNDAGQIGDGGEPHSTEPL